MKPYTKKTKISFLAILALLLLSVVLAACGEPTSTLQPAVTSGAGATAAPTNTSVPPTSVAPTTAPATATPTNTPVVVPTATPLPTNTPLPTSTPVPTVTQAPPTNTPVPATATPTATPVKTYQPVVWFSAASLKVGDSLTVSGSGYPANTKLEIYLTPEGGAKDGPYATPTTDANGSFKATVKLDKSKQGAAFVPGKLSVQASVEGGNLGAGAPVMLVAAVTPTTAPATKTAVPQTTASASKDHWVDVNLSTQTMKFMEGSKVVRTNKITSGKKGYETPVGTFYINRRVYNETMVGGTPGAEDYYYLENVLYTQYFTNQGHALHYAWWRSQFGVTGSHGCVNEDLGTAKYAWDFLTIGSKVSIHY